MKLTVTENILIHDFIETGQQPVYSFPFHKMPIRTDPLPLPGPVVKENVGHKLLKSGSSRKLS